MRLLQFGVMMLGFGIGLAGQAKAVPQTKPVSYAKQIWPIIQAKCQACHQPASAGGKLVLTSYADFTKGGEHGVSFVPKQPEKSPLLDYLTGQKTLMPKGGPPLSTAEIGLFRRWIAEGATDDTPAVKDPIDTAHPPTYTQPSVITALAFSPDGKTLAVSGYRETLLHQADGSGLIARLVGKSQKILSLLYSADGKTLAAVGGTPALFGEVQFWDTTNNQLQNTIQTTYDTLFGASLSPDGKQLAFGNPDNSLRVISVPEGKPLMKFDNHSDWIFATTFTQDSKHVLSTGRDRAIKLVVVESASFIDDINTHTSAYRAMARYPKADQVLVAGDDGIPRLYQVFRTKVRTMNQEDHNLLRVYERQPKVVTALAFSPDGSLFALGTENSPVKVYATDNGGTAEPDKPVTGGTPRLILAGHKGAIYALTFSPDGKTLATGGFDGRVRLYDLASGKLRQTFVPAPLSKQAVGSRQ